MDIKSIAHEINTQDNRITADPIFCVYEKDHIPYGISSDYSDSFEWYDPKDGNRSSIKDTVTKEFAKRMGYEKVYYIDVDKFINAHFTERAAKEHIRINGHNLNKPFIYVSSLFRCGEMISIRNFLKSGGST